MRRRLVAAIGALLVAAAGGCQGPRCGPVTCRVDQFCCDVTCGVCGTMGGVCPPVHCLSQPDMGNADAASAAAVDGGP